MINFDAANRARELVVRTGALLDDALRAGPQGEAVAAHAGGSGTVRMLRQPPVPTALTEATSQVDEAVKLLGEYTPTGGAPAEATRLLDLKRSIDELSLAPDRFAEFHAAMQVDGALQRQLLDAETATLVAPARIGRGAGAVMSDEAWFELGDDVHSATLNVLRRADEELRHADLAALGELTDAAKHRKLATNMPQAVDVPALRDWAALHDALRDAAERTGSSVPELVATRFPDQLGVLEPQVGRFAVGPWEPRNRLLRKVADEVRAAAPDDTVSTELLDEARRVMGSVTDSSPNGVRELRDATQRFVDEGTDVARIRTNVAMLRASLALEPPSAEVLSW